MLFCTIATYATEAVTARLARDLYTEGDWHHAYIEATRDMHKTGRHKTSSAAIGHLAALRLQPNHTAHADALERWLSRNADHAKYDWVMAERNKVNVSTKSVRRGGIIGRIARGVIGFYQNQIGRAIGQRCSMQPSCSRYALEAFQQYGLAGIPMTADRIIRETDHIRYRINPIMHNGRERYYDPVSAHSHWFRKYQP